jgi:hypothetical protein
MKKLVCFIVIASTLLLTSCTMPDPKTISFSPNATESTKAEIEFYQQMLEYAPFPNGVSFYPYSASYDEDKTHLTVNGFIRNNTVSTVFAIEANMIVEQDGATVADGYFHFELNDFGALPMKESRPWSLVYSVDQINLTTADFSRQFFVSSDFRYEITESADKFDLSSKERVK